MASTTRNRSVPIHLKNNSKSTGKITSVTPVTIPNDFLGMCLMEYPAANISATGVLSWKNMRMSQMAQARWSTIEKIGGDTANMLNYPYDLSNVAWTNASVTVATNYVADPGNSNQGMLINLSATLHAQYQYITVLPNTTYTYSFYAKRGTATDMKYSIFDGTHSADIVSPTSYYASTNSSTWSRITRTFTTPAGCTSIAIYTVRDSGVTGTAYVAWPKLELGSAATAVVATTYDPTALATLDSIITYQRQNGASVYYGLYGTPPTYAGNTAHPTTADNVTVGQWGVVSEGAAPTSLQAVTNFVTMLVQRYNTPGGAWYNTYGATLGKGIQYWETWNEPSFGDSNVSQFWWGTCPILVDVAYTQYAAAKAVDPSIIVTSPGFSGVAVSNSNSAHAQFMATTGPSTGKTGAQACDWLAWHPYGLTPPAVQYGTSYKWAYDIITADAGALTLRNWMTKNGYNHPFCISEVGVDAGTVNVGISAMTWSAGVVSVTANGHNLTSGDVVRISGSVPVGYVGNYPVTVTGVNTFTFQLASNPGTVTTLGTVYTNQALFNWYNQAAYNLVWSSGNVTVTTVIPHLYNTGDSITVSGCSPAGYNGTFTITVTGTNTFTYPLAGNPGALTTYGLIDNPAMRYRWMSRYLMTVAGFGVKSVHFWHWEELGITSNSGQWQVDLQGVTKAYNDFATNCVGKTITGTSYTMPGPITLTFSDGSSYTV